MLPVLDHEETRSKGSSYQNQRPYPQTGKYGDSIDVVSRTPQGQIRPPARGKEKGPFGYVRLYTKPERERERGARIQMDQIGRAHV